LQISRLPVEVEKRQDATGFTVHYDFRANARQNIL
jgi:hypothetical protein